MPLYMNTTRHRLSVEVLGRETTTSIHERRSGQDKPDMMYSAWTPQLEIANEFSLSDSPGKFIAFNYWISFGSDSQCHGLFPADVASQVHCKIYAQLNSGSQGWLVDDSSTHGKESRS